MAQTAATLQQLSGGRFDLGIGVSHRIAVEGWHGTTMDRPATEFKEYVRVLRGILTGTPARTGRRWGSTLRLSGIAPIPTPRVYGAALSPAMLRTVGETCDGAMLWLCSPQYIRDVVIGELATGRQRAGKTMEGFDLVANVPAAGADDAEHAYAALGRQLISYLQLPFYRAVVERSGFGSDLARFDDAARRGDGEPMADAPSLELLQSLAAVGREGALREALDAYRAAGVTTPAVSPIPGLGTEAALTAAAPSPAPAVNSPADR